MQKWLYIISEFARDKWVVPFPVLAKSKIFVLPEADTLHSLEYKQVEEEEGFFPYLTSRMDFYLRSWMVAFTLWTTTIVSPLGCAFAEGRLWGCAPSGGTSLEEGGQLLNEENQDSDQGMISPSSMALLLE